MHIGPVVKGGLLTLLRALQPYQLDRIRKKVYKDNRIYDILIIDDIFRERTQKTIIHIDESLPLIIYTKTFFVWIKQRMENFSSRACIYMIGIIDMRESMNTIHNV